MSKINLDDFLKEIGIEQPPTPKEKAEIEKTQAYAEYLKAKAEAERIKAESSAKKEIRKDEKSNDIIFLISTIVAFASIVAEIILLLKVIK